MASGSTTVLDQVLDNDVGLSRDAGTQRASKSQCNAELSDENIHANVFQHSLWSKQWTWLRCAVQTTEIFHHQETF